MVKHAIIIQKKKFVIKYLDVYLMMVIVFHMKIVILLHKRIVMELLNQEFNVFGILILNHVLNINLAIVYH